MAEAIPTPRTLDEFIETLSAQRGLHRRVRLLGHYWRQVRDLPSEDRQRIALALGSESAWRHLEKFFGADGHLTEGELAVKRALQRVGSAEPEELRILASRLRSGDYTEVGSELLDAMSQALDAEVGIEPAHQLDAEPEVAKALQLEPEPEPAPEPEPVPVPEPEPELEPEPEPEPEPELGIEPEPAPESEQSVEVPETALLPAARRADVREPASERESQRDREAGPRADLEDRAERRRLMIAGGTGWRQRRYLGELIRERQLDSLDEALELAALFESDVQRAWCLGDLVQHWPLDGQDLGRVLDAAPSASLRARLRGRYERAAS